MGQDVIWDHFQNEGIGSFAGAGPRLEYLVRHLRAGERALNIGVGSGALEALALEKGIEIWSLDPSDRAIGGLRERLALGDRARVGYCEAMPFEDGQFDTVVMTEVLEHLDSDVREKTLLEVHRVLKPHGRLIGTVPARERLQDSEVVCPNCEHHFHRWGHQAAFDLSSMTRTLASLFTPEIVREHFFNEWKSAPWSRRASGLIKKILSWRGLGTYGAARNIFFVARKEG